MRSIWHSLFPYLPRGNAGLRPSPERQRRLGVEFLEPRRVLSHTNPNATLAVGVYDENVIDQNTVDFVAGGSNMTNSQFASDVAAAFSANRGGVINGSVLGAFHAFGAGHTKVLRLGLAEGTNFGIGSAYHISGTGGFASTSDGGYDYTSLNFVDIAGAASNERVVAMGVTALSITGRDYGNVTVTARLASGSSLAATRRINNATGSGDTFYGFRAPDGDYITGFSLRYDGPVFGTPDTRLWFDDIGFVTDIVAPANSPPVANGDVFSTGEDAALEIAASAILANDSDPDADALAITAITQPANGSTVIDGSGKITYTPAVNYYGTDSFTYTISDGRGGTATATVTVNVGAVNDAPVNAVPSSQTALEDVPHQIDGISISDVDAGTGEVKVNLSVGAGMLTVSDSAGGGLTASGIAGNGSSSVELRGTVAQINATLAAGVTYQGSLNFSGLDILTVSTDDQGQAGSGGPLVDTDTVAIRVLSAAEQAELLRLQVNALYADGTLSRGQANSLKSKLELSGKSRDSKFVQSFIDKVLAYVDAGILTQQQADPLLAGGRNLLISISTR